MSPKTDLRQRAKAVRGRFFATKSPSDLLMLEEKRVEALWKYSLFQDFLQQAQESIIGVYAPLRDEASTELLMSKLSKQGCVMALPRLSLEGEMHFGSFPFLVVGFLSVPFKAP